MNTTITLPSPGHPSLPAARGWLAGRKAAGAYLGLSPRTINRWMTRGVLRYRRLSPKLVMFRPADLDAAVESLATQAAST